MTPEFFLTSIIVILIPGSGVIYTLAFGLSRGWRPSILAALGCTLGIVPHVIATVAGLAALLHTSALAFQAVRYLGVAYLIYMAWSVWRNQGAFEFSEQTSKVSATRIVVNGFLLNILNPKLSLFFLAFLPQFVPDAAAGPTAYMLVLAAIFMLLTFVIFVGYGAFATIARHYVVSRPRTILWLRRSFAGAFGLLGLRLALTDR